MRALVTGSSGFLGHAIALELLRAGHEVRAATRRPVPELEALGARAVQLELDDPHSVENAVAGCDSVFHAAALTGIWGPKREFMRINLGGTRRVLEACGRQGVQRLVYTSSPSVCFDGRSHVRASNELPRARRFESPYPHSKALAEREVLAANGTNELHTIALRPHLILGERDPHLLPRLIERARRGKLIAVGPGDNEVSLCWVENAAHAHVAAAEALRPGARCAGRAYFVAQEDPVRLWPWIGELLAGLGIEPPRWNVSLGLARALGLGCELAWRGLGLRGEPPMTRFLASQLALSHSYDMAPARRDFGYRERVSMSEATQRLLHCWRARIDVRASGG